MATFNSTTAAAQIAAEADVSKRINGDPVNGRVHVAASTWVKSATEVQNDLIMVAKLPGGAIFLPHLSRAAFEVDDSQATGKYVAINAAGS